MATSDVSDNTPVADSETPAAGAEETSHAEPAAPAEPAVVAEPKPAKAAPAPAPEAEKKSPNLEWYVLKVQSNREDSIRDSIVKRIKIQGLDEFVNEVVVPVEKVTEIKDGKKKVVERKFYPGYIMIHVELNDDIWFVLRETPGVGDFINAGGKPLPMTAQDVAKMLGRQTESEQQAPRIQFKFNKGDRVKIKEGTFENFEGDVDEINESKGLVRVMIKIFNRPTPVELEYWQVEAL